MRNTYYWEVEFSEGIIEDFTLSMGNLDNYRPLGLAIRICTLHMQLPFLVNMANEIEQ